MKKFFLVIAVLFTALSLNAQDQKVGDIRVNAGVGLPTTFSNLLVPPVSVSADYLLKNDLYDGQVAVSVGAYLGYFAQSNSFSILGVTQSHLYNYGVLGAKSKLFYDVFKIKGLKTYASLMLGLKMHNDRTSYESKPISILGNTIEEAATSSSSSNTSFGFGWNTAIGATYEVAPNLDVYGELGYGFSILELGISYKL